MKKIFAIALGVLALASCAREAAPVKVESSREVKFTTNVNTFTMKAGETALEGKTVQVLAGTPLNTGSAAVVTGNSLTLTNKMYWKDGQTEKTTFVAIYPGENQTATTIPNYVITDDFAYHANFMTATAKDVAPETTVALNFKHPFSKVVVNVTNNLTGTPAVTSVALEGVVLSADLDLAAETLTLGNDKVNVNATAQEDGSFAAIIMPQTVKPALIVTVGEKAYRFVLAEEFTFAANKAYTAAVTLEDSTTPVEEGGEVAFNVDVTDWEAAAEALPYVAEQTGEEALPVTALYLLGDACDAGWSIDAALPLTKEGNVFSLTTNLYANKQFRFLAQKESNVWFPSVVKAKADGKAVYCASQAEWDANSAENYDHFYVAEDGVYDIAVDIVAKTVTLNRKGDLPKATWYVIGDVYTDDDTVVAWSTDFPMTEVEGVWTITINVRSEFKLRAYAEGTADAAKWNTQLGMWASDSNTYMDVANTYGLADNSTGKENKNIAFAEAGLYKLELTGTELAATKL